MKNEKNLKDLSLFDESRRLQQQKNLQKNTKSKGKQIHKKQKTHVDSNLHSAKQILNFSPKSSKLKRPIIFEFDLYVRAATEIQRVYRGYHSRKINGGLFHKMRAAAIKI